METFKAGDIISVRHYSGISPFKSIILEANENSVLVKLTKEFAIMNFLEGDPVVFGTEKGDRVIIVGCNIGEIRPKEDIIELKIDKVEEDAQKRQWERFPVSLFADVRSRDSRKKQVATIKDISHYGMLIYSKADYPVNEQVEVDIYMDKSMVFLKANIARKAERKHYFEYGVGILYEDSSSLNFMKEYIKRLMQEQEEAIRKLKNK